MISGYKGKNLASFTYPCDAIERYGIPSKFAHGDIPRYRVFVGEGIKGRKNNGRNKSSLHESTRRMTFFMSG
jgi:hypothetical protein